MGMNNHNACVITPLLPASPDIIAAIKLWLQETFIHSEIIDDGWEITIKWPTKTKCLLLVCADYLFVGAQIPTSGTMNSATSKLDYHGERFFARLRSAIEDYFAFR